MRGAVRRQGQGRGRGAEGEGEAEVSAQADSCGRGCPSPRGGGKRMTCDFLCLGHRNLVKVFRALLALSASPPAPVLPVVAWWGIHPLRIVHRCFSVNLNVVDLAWCRQLLNSSIVSLVCMSASGRLYALCSDEVEDLSPERQQISCACYR